MSTACCEPLPSSSASLLGNPVYRKIRDLDHSRLSLIVFLVAKALYEDRGVLNRRADALGEIEEVIRHHGLAPDPTDI